MGQCDNHCEIVKPLCKGKRHESDSRKTAVNLLFDMILSLHPAGRSQVLGRQPVCSLTPGSGSQDHSTAANSKTIFGVLPHPPTHNYPTNTSVLLVTMSAGNLSRDYRKPRLS